MRSNLLLALLVAAATSAEAAVVHVSTSGSDTNSGADWAHAKATVGAALTVAAAGDEIWVAAGVYGERIRNRVVAGISVDVGLYGGFAGDETTRDGRDLAANITVLDGGGLGSVVTIDSSAGPGMRIDGFRIRNGEAGSGGGISVLASAPTIVNNSILGNIADFGGGILVWGDRNLPPAAQAQILFNVIQANFAYDGGAGITLVGSSALIRGNTIRFNSTYGRGGGIGVWISESALVARPVIENNRIQENRSNVAADGAIIGGGGIFATERNLDDEPLGGISAPRIRSNFIAANSAVAMGGGIAIINSENESTPIVNNTVVANSGSGIAWGNAGPTIVNNIVAFNTWGLDEDLGNPYPESIRFNDVYGNAVHDRPTNYYQLADLTGTDGNVSVDPRLATFGSGRAHVQPGSPCIDAGDPLAIGGDWLDIDLQPRTAGLRVDIGADEADGTAWPDLPSIVHVRPGGSDALDGLAWATAKATVEAAIEAAVSLGGGEVWVAEGTYVEHVTLAAWVHVYGGFAGTETQRAERDPAAHLTVLDGGEVPPVVNCGAAGYRVGTLDGFRITRGGLYNGGTSLPPSNRPAGLGGGIRCDASSPVISGNEITRNSLGHPREVPDFPSLGAGIGLLGSHALLLGNTFTENEVLETSGQGGAIYCEWSLVDAVANTITRNHAPYGPGVYCLYARPMFRGNVFRTNENYHLPPLYFGDTYGSSQLTSCWDLEFDGNLFESNQAMTGGALYISSSDRGTIANNLFVGNKAQTRSGMGGEGGAILLIVSPTPKDDVKITGNTFVGNTATDIFNGEQGGAIALLPWTNRVVIANNVMAFNSSGIYRRAGATAVPALLDNTMWNGAYDYVNVTPGPGDVHADPLFVDRPGGDYRLTLASSCVDGGSNTHAPYAFDRDGATRIQDGRWTGTAIVDRGAYEYSPDFDGDGSLDWRDPDDDDDGASDPSDCAPFNAGAWNVPVAVRDVRLAGHATVTLTWAGQDPATRYDVAGASLAGLLATGNFSSAECRANDLAAPPWTDDRSGPVAGDARYYLLRAASVCGDGGWGRDGGGAERLLSACP